MTTKTRNPTASPKRRTAGKKAASRKSPATQEPAGDSTAPKKTRSRRKAPAPPETAPIIPEDSPREVTIRPPGFFLASQGVTFGPFTEFQLRESIRLGLFQNDDLAVSEQGSEWLEVSRLLPMLEIDAPPPVKRPPAPLSEHHLREHETYFAEAPAASFLAELARGRFAFAAVPVAVLVVCLLTLAAAFKHDELSAKLRAQPHFSQKSSSVRPLGKESALLTPVSLPLGGPAAASHR